MNCEDDEADEDDGVAIDDEACGFPGQRRRKKGR